MAINPFAQPINYSAQFVDLTPAFRAAGEGFRAIGEGIQEREKQEQAMTLKAQYATDLQNALNNPTQETWSQMIAKYPQQREAFAEARKGFGETALANEFNQGFEVSTALENKRPEVAKERLQTFITARKNSNLPTGIYEDATCPESGFELVNWENIDVLHDQLTPVWGTMAISATNQTSNSVCVHKYIKRNKLNPVLYSDASNAWQKGGILFAYYCESNVSPLPVLNAWIRVYFTDA